MEAKLVHANLCAVAFYHGRGMLSPLKLKCWMGISWDCEYIVGWRRCETVLLTAVVCFFFFQEPKSCDLTAMSSQTSFGSSMLCESWFVISAQCIFIHLGVLSYANISMLLFVVCIQSRVLMMTWMHRWLQPTSCPGSSVPCWRRPPPKTTTQTLALRYTQTFSTDFLFSAFSLKQTVVILCAI